MSVNAHYPHLDNQSECAGCQRWLDDQVLTEIREKMWCADCRPCFECPDTAEMRDGKPVYPTHHNSPVGLCYWCARESISL